MGLVALVKSVFSGQSVTWHRRKQQPHMSDSMDFPRNDQLVIDLGGVHNPMEPLVFGRYRHWEGEEMSP